MGIFAELAGLRPMMPMDQLKRAIGRDWRPPAGGWLSIGDAFSARVDVKGKIGFISFGEEFPAALSINGLHVGMTLDGLMASTFDFRLVRQRHYPFKLTDYVCATTDGNELRARVDADGLVRQVEITRPGLTYSEGSRLGQDAAVEVSPWDYDDINEMLSRLGPRVPPSVSIRVLDFTIGSRHRPPPTAGTARLVSGIGMTVSSHCCG